jgi:hypothetical protein
MYALKNIIKKIDSKNRQNLHIFPLKAPLRLTRGCQRNANATPTQRQRNANATPTQRQRNANATPTQR